MSEYWQINQYIGALLVIWSLNTPVDAVMQVAVIMVIIISVQWGNCCHIVVFECVMSLSEWLMTADLTAH